MLLVLCILMSAYFIRGITGFGSALIAVPMLALSQPLQFAVPLVLALDFTASLILGGTNTKKANWAEVKLLLPFGMLGACGGAGALFGAGSPPYIMYLTRRLLDKGAVRATFSWLIAIDGGFRLGLFLFAGLLFDPKLEIAYALGLAPMAIGLYSGNKVHLDMTSGGMLRVVGALLVLSGAMLFLKVAA